MWLFFKSTKLISMILIINCVTLSFCEHRQKCLFKKCLTHIADLEMQSGDMISCRRYFFLPYHNLLATGPDSIIHIVADRRVKKGHIVEESRDEYIARNQESWCFNEGPGSVGRVEAVKSAKDSFTRFKNKQIYYSLLKCNCQHWVEYWANGNPKSPSTWKMPIDERCQISR